MNNLLNKVTPLIPIELRSKILNIYPYGSQVYGTASIQSDEDFIVVVSEGESQWLLGHTIDIHIYNLETFNQKLVEQHMPFLECIFLAPEFKFETKIIKSKIDLTQLRIASSSVASNSWVKAKKKINQGDTYLGLKSLYHSIRILDFANQIASTGSIQNYSSVNYIWQEIKDLKQVEYSELKAKYQEVYNTKASLLRSLCPKN